MGSFVCFLCIFTPMRCASTHSSSSISELRQKICSLRCTEKKKKTFREAVGYTGKGIVKSLFYPSHPPALLLLSRFLRPSLCTSDVISFHLGGKGADGLFPRHDALGCDGDRGGTWPPLSPPSTRISRRKEGRRQKRTLISALWRHMLLPVLYKLAIPVRF